MRGCESTITTKSTDALVDGGILIAVSHSSLNYKDMLSASGNKGVTKHYPHTPGIDAAGVVIESDEPSLPIGTDVVVAGANFRFGRGRSGDLELLRQLDLDVRAVPLVEGVSSTRIRDLLRAGEVERAARLLGRPAEIEGTVVAGDARGGTLGFPTANLRAEPGLLVPGYGIYAGAADGTRAAISIGTNPHYGGGERRIEAFLLDFDGDLYGRKLRLQLWERLRDELAFESEDELVAQIEQYAAGVLPAF